MTEEESVTYRPIARHRLGKRIPAQEYAPTIRRPLLGKKLVNKPSQKCGGCFLRGPCREIIKGKRRSFE
jgi:hypothetical protein